MTRQMADDEVLRVLDDAATQLRQWQRDHGQCIGTMEVLAKLREAKPAVAAIQAERDKLEALRGQVAGLVGLLAECREELADKLADDESPDGYIAIDLVERADAALLAIKERMG